MRAAASYKKELISITLLLSLITFFVYDLELISTNNTTPLTALKAVTLPHPRLNTRIIQKSVVVKKGDTFYGLLQSLNANEKHINQLTLSADHSPFLHHLTPGQVINVLIAHDGELQGINTKTKNNEELNLIREGNQYIKTLTPLHTEAIPTLRFNIITSSFLASAQKANIPRKIQHQFQTLFSGAINFSKEIKKGDSFSILYNEKRIEGKLTGVNDIDVAVLQHNKQDYFAIRYQIKGRQNGYYNSHGKSIESRFLKFPLTFKRISSRFSLRRLDPVTHKFRPHYGVDLAAPMGTPIHSIGSGKIIYKGWARGYGNTIKVRYDNRHVGLYAHLSRYANIRNRQWVKRGQLIGYVGQSGWATGPHLHFGWYVNNTPKDPLKRKMVHYPPIPPSERPSFNTHRDHLIKKLSLLQQQQLLTTHG